MYNLTKEGTQQRINDMEREIEETRDYIPMEHEQLLQDSMNDLHKSLKEDFKNE